MKNLLTIVIGFTLIFLATSFTKFSSHISSDEKIEVYFSNKLDFNDLVKMKLDL